MPENFMSWRSEVIPASRIMPSCLSMFFHSISECGWAAIPQGESPARRAGSARAAARTAAASLILFMQWFLELR